MLRMYKSIPDYMDIEALLSSTTVKYALMYDKRLYIYIYKDTKFYTKHLKYSLQM